MLQPTHLRTLRAVLATGSLAGAGARLGFTASAVSQQMATLERATGLTLLERGPRSVQPTPAAEALARRAGALLDQLDLLEREVRVMAAGGQGAVRIGSFPSASASLLPQALARLARSRARVEVLLDEAEPADLVPRLLGGALDLALVYEYDAVPTPWPGELTRTGLLREELLVLLPRGHRLADAPSVDLAELAGERWASSLEGTAGSRTLDRLCAARGFEPRVDYRSNDYTVLRGIVAADVCVALVPALSHTSDQGVRLLPLAATDAGRQVHVLRRTDDPNPLLPPVLDALVRASRAQGRHQRGVLSL